MTSLEAPNTIANKRDDSLDIIKGFSCVLMVIAHQPYVYKDPAIVLGLINHLVSLIPPPLFFAIAGVTTTFQTTKYSLRSLTLYFIAMFCLGIAWNDMVHGDISSFYWPEIFQTIALGSLVVCVIERNGPASQSMLFLISTGILLTKPIVNWFFPHFDGWNFLFCDNEYVAQVNAGVQNPTLLPGFPLFPWMGYFVLGVWCYRASKRLKLTAGIVSLCLVLISVALGSNAIEKWNSSIAYIFACCADTFIVFWLFDTPFPATSMLTKQLQKLGSNAFLFFFLHPLGLAAGVALYLQYPNAYMAWILSIIIAVFIYNLVSRLKPWKLLESKYAWITIIAALFFIPFLPQLIEHKSMPVITRLLAMIIGIIAAINFNSLAKLTKTKKTLPR